MVFFQWSRPRLLTALLAVAVLSAACTSSTTPPVVSSGLPGTSATSASVPTVGSGTVGSGSVGSGSVGSGTVGSGTVRSTSAESAGTGSAGRPAATSTRTPTPTSARTTEPSTTRATVPGTPGNIHQTVPTSAASTAAPVPITGTASFGGKVFATVSKLTKTTLTAQGPGEFAGPGIEVTIVIRNGSAATIDLSAVTVTVVGANDVAAIPVQGGTVVPFSGRLIPGRSTTGVYVFSLHSKPSNPVTLAVDYSTGAPVVAFTGSL